MNNIYDPKNIVKEEHPYQEDYLEEKKYIEFKVGQSYEKIPARTLYCKHCGSDIFKVAKGDCFTAVKCINCKYEVCIHDG